MKKTDELLFTLLRVVLCDETPATDCFVALTAEEWKALFGEAQRQNVAALAWEGIARMPEEVHPPKPTRIYWKAEWQKTVDGAARKQAVTQRLVDFFAAHGIKTYVLKGARLGVCYPNPLLRNYSDIDIYQGDQWRQADELVARELGGTIKKGMHHHTCYKVEGEKVENHYHLLNHYKYRSNVRYEREMLRHFGSPTFDALFLLRHTACHFAVDRIGVRHLCDWMQFVRRHGGEVDWQAVRTICRRYGMERFYDAIQEIIAAKLHYCCPDGRLAEGSKELSAVAQQVYDDLFQPPKEDGALKTFRHNRWKHKLVFTDPWAWAFCQRVFSTFTHA